MLLESIDDSRTDAFTESLSSESLIRISTSRAFAFNDLAVALEQAEDPPDVEVLTDDETVTELRDHFLSGTKLREHIENEILALKTQSLHLPTLILADTDATAITGLPETDQISVAATEAAFVEESTSAFDSWFDEAEPVSLRKPSYSQLLSELEEQFDESVRADFVAALQEAKVADRPSLSLHPANLGLLVGAYHQLEFYHVGGWGEETRLASRATFSRMKNRLEEKSIIEIEPVSGKVGRPRHQLQLESGYEEGSIEDVVQSVEEELG